MRVGEKETSEHAAIVARYADLFTREQHAALAEATDAAPADEHERLLPAARVRGRRGDLARARGGLRRAPEQAASPRASSSKGESLPLRSAQAQVALIDDYARREELGRLAGDVSPGSTTTGST